MLEKIKEYFVNKKEQHHHDYDLTFDNVAIPEVHTHKPPEHEYEYDTDNQPPISYDNVAIPEVHLKKKEH